MRNECLVLGLLFLFGCSGEDEDKLPTREEFCRAWGEAACSKETVSRCQARNAEACHLSQQQFCLSLVPSSFSGERSDQCLVAVGKAYQDGDLSSGELRTVLRLDEPCHLLVRGPKQQGQSCSEIDDCNAAGGFECVKKAGEFVGACEIPEVVDPGLACDAPQQVCTDGFFCNGDNCIGAKDVGDPCTNHDECGASAYCSNAGQCVERSGVDTNCTADFECESGVCYAFMSEQVCIDRLTLGRSEPICADLR